MNRFRYKYKPKIKGVKLSDIKCPICKNGVINWFKPVSSVNWDGSCVLLAECWSGKTYEEKDRHLFYIKINEDVLPTIVIDEVKK